MGKMADLREALAGSLASLPGVQENAYVLGNPTPPAVEVEPGLIEYDLAMHRGLDKWRFVVRLFIATTTDIGVQKRLDEFMDPTGASSVKALLEADRTLGGACDFVQVLSCSGYRTYAAGRSGSISLGAEWTVQVHVSN